MAPPLAAGIADVAWDHAMADDAVALLEAVHALGRDDISRIFVAEHEGIGQISPLDVEAFSLPEVDVGPANSAIGGSDEDLARRELGRRQARLAQAVRGGDLNSVHVFRQQQRRLLPNLARFNRALARGLRKVRPLAHSTTPIERKIVHLSN